MNNLDIILTKITSLPIFKKNRKYILRTIDNSHYNLVNLYFKQRSRIHIHVINRLCLYSSPTFLLIMYFILTSESNI